MKILFHHLAKTAGTSLIESFLAHFGDRVCPSRYDFELTEETIASPDFSFYHGHFSFERVQQFRDANPDSFVFTFLRNPLNRVISQYYNWVDRKRTETEYQAIAERGAAAPDFIRNQLLIFESDIFGKSLAEFLESGAPTAIDVVENHQVRYLSRAATYRARRTDGLMEACDHLESFYDFVGLTEWYGESLSELNRQLKLPPGTLSSDVVKNTNESVKTDGAYVISPENWNKIFELNTLDLSLFTFAAALLRSRLASSSSAGVLGTIAGRVHFPELAVPQT